MSFHLCETDFGLSLRRISMQNHFDTTHILVSIFAFTVSVVTMYTFITHEALYVTMSTVQKKGDQLKHFVNYMCHSTHNGNENLQTLTNRKSI